MTVKKPFYNSLHERMLAGAIDKLYNDYVGYASNQKDDGQPYTEWTAESLVKQITKDILSEPKYLEIEESWDVIEAKHIRFMGKIRVEEIVDHRVRYRIRKDNPELSVEGQ